ncbi:hypothetical protein MNV49_007696 [Pseudohyphozyma bogoriensis]|nr:hypothetical protein MNV49_007696 [Pseudohyphozyma bogoriensis]
MPASDAPTSEMDVDVLEERNGSPATSPSPKRKIEAETPSHSNTENKKPKLADASSPAPSSSKPAGASTNASSGPSTTDLPVELKGGKLVLKQKALGNWDLLISSMKGRLDFATYMAPMLDTPKDKLHTLAPEHHGVVARMIHESDKTLASLATSVRKQLVDYVKANAGQEDSQEADAEEEKKDAMPVAERIPLAMIKSLIEQLATRENYGLDVTDLPNGLPDGVTEIPATLQVFRWEVKDVSLLPPEAKNIDKRKTEREEAKSSAKSLFLALPESEQLALLTKSAGGKKAKASKDDAPSSSAAAPKSEEKEEPVKEVKEKKAKEEKEKKVKVEDPKAAEEKAKKAKEIAEKAAIKQAKKEEREKANAEKEEKKAKKAKEAAEKKEKEDKVKAANAKSANIMSGFFIKKSASPAPASLAPSSSTPGGSKETDFTRTFKPFFERPGVEVAPYNRFAKKNKGKEVEINIDGDESLTAKDSLASFMSRVPPHHVLEYKPCPQPFLSVRDTVHAINESATVGLDSTQYYKDLQNRRKVQTKFLKFDGDVRPGYVGTWTKRSRVVGPRTPFGKDTALLRYDYDSEEEWEDEEADPDAEDVESLGERSDEEDSDGGLSDDWMCDDDEVEFEPGHGEEDALPMDLDSDLIVVGGDLAAAKKKIEDREKKSKSLKDAKRKRLQGPILPLVKGPVWEKKVGEPRYDAFRPMKIQFLNDAHFGLNPFKWTSTQPETLKPVSKPTTSTDANADASTSKSTSAPARAPGVTSGKPAKAPAKPVKALPDSIMPKFIEMVDGSSKNQAGLQEDLYTKLGCRGKDGAKVTRPMLEAALKTFAVREKKDNASPKTWQVNSAIKAKFTDAIVVD